MVSGGEEFVGRVLGNKYKILEFLGEGSAARVYLAKDLEGDRFVAIKAVKSELTADGTFLGRFQNEAKTLAKLRSPFAVRVFDYGMEDELNYIVMEFVPGRTLDRIIKEEGSLGLEEALSIARQVAQCLRAAQEVEVVHRDIKPANIMVTADGSVKVMDFGIARSLIKTGLTQTGVLGTPYYVSPEQADGKELDSRSDIYSLGCTFYQMLTGHPPYEGDNPVAVIMKHLQAPIPKISKDRPDLDPEVDEIAAKCMEKDPKERSWPADLMTAIDDLALKLEIVLPRGGDGGVWEEIKKLKEAVNGLSRRIASLQSDLDRLARRVDEIPGPGIPKLWGIVGVVITVFLVAIACGVGSFLPPASAIATPTPMNLATITAQIQALETLPSEVNQLASRLHNRDAQTVDAYIHLGWLYMENEAYSSAQAMFETAITLRQDSPFAYEGVGWSYYQRGMYNEAISAFQQALTLDESVLNAYNGIGWAYYNINDCDQAVWYFQQVLDRDPDGPFASSAENGLQECGVQ